MRYLVLFIIILVILLLLVSDSSSNGVFIGPKGLSIDYNYPQVNIIQPFPDKQCYTNYWAEVVCPASLGQFNPFPKYKKQHVWVGNEQFNPIAKSKN